MGKMARSTYFLLVVILLSSTCLQVTVGMMSPDMVRGMMASNELQPHLPGSVSAECMADLASVLAKETDFISVLDAIGKPQSGLLAGNLAWVGHYDECTNITDFKYCMSYLSVPVNSSDIHTQVIQLSWGLCVPVSCSDSDILSSLELILDAIAPESPIDISAVNASAVACAKQPTAPYDTGFLLTVLIIAILGVFMVLGAFLDVTFRSINYKPATEGTPELNVNTTPNRSSNDGEGEPLVSDVTESRERHVQSACNSAWQRFLLCFAVNRNITKLLSVQASEGGIDCLNGIRVISMSWVILGHSALFQLTTGIVGNLLYGLNVMGTFGFQAVGNGYVSVDSFFYLSGLLVAYMALGKMQKTGGSIPWLWFYFHRYWRLTPALGMTTLIWLFIRPHMGNGPVWHLATAKDPCSKYWWTNILYINNFYHPECIGWVWYLANDMQFFLISPFILILLYRVPKFGLLTLAGMTVASAITTAILMVMNDLSATLNILGDANGGAFGNIIYLKPYCRISPYLIGMAMGYFLHVNKKTTFKLHPSTVAGGWAVATAIAMAIVYGLYGGYHGNPLSTAASAAYLSLSKIGWAVSLSWVVFACRYGYGGWVNEFLSWKLWTPLSRVTYGAYLLHPIILFGYFYNMKNNYFYSLYLMSFEFTGMFILSYAAAVVMALFIEFPLGNLEKMIIPSRPKKTN